MTSISMTHAFYLPIAIYAFRLMASVAMDISFKTGKLPEVAPFRSIPNVSFGKCRDECVSRPRCRSVGYRRHVPVCMLYEQDSSGTGTVVDPKVTYSEKREWSVTSLSLPCSDTCKLTEVCRIRGANPASCSIEECGAPEYPKVESQPNGNMRGVGNVVTSVCSGSVKTMVQRKCVEGGNWLRVNHTISNMIVYEGCFVDRPDRALTSVLISDHCMTIPYCADYCYTRHFVYFGVEHYRQCFCGNVMHYRIASNNCNTPCSGNHDEICGGSWALSIYTYTTMDKPT